MLRHSEQHGSGGDGSQERFGRSWLVADDNLPVHLAGPTARTAEHHRRCPVPSVAKGGPQEEMERGGDALAWRTSEEEGRQLRDLMSFAHDTWTACRCVALDPHGF